jgi:hypothetical protein
MFVLTALSPFPTQLDHQFRLRDPEGYRVPWSAVC